MSDSNPQATPPGEERREDEESPARNARHGLVLFLVYLAFYAGFMALNVLRPQAMSENGGGVNVAILYGFGLIVAALVLAFVYMHLCRNSGGPEGGGRS
ncbi:MAG: DUF485 domain-containing protein [Planctomycetes bacterium]|nr:DUF485 domain-containing protein [Planctomycetota bacterium]